MAQTQHHHRSTTKTANKPFKARHASKSSLKNQAKGKVEDWERGTRKTPHQQVMSKLDRRNRAKQLRVNHNAEREEKASVFAGRDGAPRIVSVVPLCQDITLHEVLNSLNASVDVEEEVSQQSHSSRVEIPRFKQRVHYLTPARDLIQTLDACRTADFVLFVLSANEEVDSLGEQMLRCIESQGVSTVLTGVYGLDKVEPAKKRPDVVKSLKSFIAHFFAAQEKVHDLSSRQDCSNVMRSLCTTMPKGIRWREDRSWMLLEDCAFDGDHAIVTGVVRGKGLKADRLVQIGDWGDLQIDKITAAPAQTRSRRAKVDEMTVDAPDGEKVLDSPTEEQDDLAELAPEEAIMEDIAATSIAPSERKAVLLDDHHYFDEDDRNQLPAPKRLPKGTSKYQAAWYLGDVSDSGSDLEDVDDEDDDDMDFDGSVAAGPADGHFDDVMREPTEAGAPSEYPQSEAFGDHAPEDEADQIEAYRQQRRDEAEDDLEFPDEIELHPGVNARERLARYRGLKSLRTSHWETEEDKPYEPDEWTRLLEIADYKSAKNRVLKEALHGGVKPGTRVHVHLRIPEGRLNELHSLPRPTALFSLLRHEHKRTAVNVSLTLSSDYPAPLKSKEELILQCGPRRLVINPLFSQAGNTPNNVHKFDRYMHPGRTAVATFIGPVTWGSVPCLFFKPSTPRAPIDAIEDLAASLAPSKEPALGLIATGTTLPPSTQRIIAKRIILAGHPYKIHKKLVTVRYMFFSAEDVQYFRALQLWTKRGRSGFIKETLGTHGYFKATFDGKVNPLDAVAVSLYKRVWPRQARSWNSQRNGDSDEAPQLVSAQAGDGMVE
ncbi:pre-rRNA processing Tsr1 [Lecanosticta acicola]|uniref:Pre-rRNA processing Tsr1 n=1 Tax=Lecanosticta acicola TaxID=111012 RepID=A0AAI8Z4F2_9PEZI|nr:pre-rRNA processing Tsr1 [Lecanosticta acicola]